MLIIPLCVTTQMGFAHVPAGFEEHCLEGVHGDVVVGAVSTGVNVIVAMPVPHIPPVHIRSIPAAQADLTARILQRMNI